MANGINPGVGAYSGSGNVANDQQFYALAGMGGQLGFTATGADQRVYMGKDYEAQAKAPVAGVPGSAAVYARQARTQAIYSVDDAIAAWNFLSPEQTKRLNKLTDRTYGYEGASVNQTLTRALWSDAVNAASMAQKFGMSEDTTPWDFLEKYASTAARSTGGGTGGAGAYTGPVTTVRLTDPDTAMGLIDQSLQGALGRSASQSEKRRFMEALKAYEMENPTVTTGDQTGTVTTGGANAQQFAQRYGLAQEGAAEYKAATTFLDAFMGALGNPVK